MMYYLLRKYHKILIVIALTTIFTGGASETILETMRQSGDIPDYMLLKVVNEHKEEIKVWESVLPSGIIWISCLEQAENRRKHGNKSGNQR